MYSTFQAFAPASPKRVSHATRASAETTLPKRAQVPRACNPCRLNRVRCGIERPCHNCKVHNRKCVDAPVEIRSLAAATVEIEKLRKRIRELEEDQQEHSVEKPGREWQGFRVDDLYYGPSSLKYFSNRLYNFIHPLLPPADLVFFPLRKPPPSPSASPVSLGCHLTKAQQDCYTDLYWLWYHPIYPVLIEAQFREHYESLWMAPETSRAPSALVDVVLALCIQFSASYTQSGSDAATSSPHNAGYDLFRRSQELLDTRKNSPCVLRVQCYILLAVYLLNGGAQNHAQEMVAKGIRVATILGFDHDILKDEAPRHQEVSRRIWWTLYILDSQLAMETGRPALMDAPASFCPPPSASLNVAQLLGTPNDETVSEVTWLAFHSQWIHLTEATRAVHDGFFAQCNASLSAADARIADIYGDAPVREACAKRLLALVKTHLDPWTAQVPGALCLRRQPSGRGSKPFDTQRAPYVLDKTAAAPLWLQRQQILLVLQYHHLCASLYRAFICFYPHPAFGTPFSDRCATAALDHAVALVLLLHQALAQTDLLAGWYPALHLQQSAARVVCGFACGYPVCPTAPGARRAARLALRTTETFLAPLGAVAREEARVLRELIDMAERKLAQFRVALQAIAPRLASLQATAEEGEEMAVAAETEPNMMATSIETPSMPDTLSPTETAAWGLGDSTATSDSGPHENEPESLWLNLEAAGLDGTWGWPQTGP